MVKSVNVASSLICQKFSAWLEENSFVRGNGIASCAAMAETHKTALNNMDTVAIMHLNLDLNCTGSSNQHKLPKATDGSFTNECQDGFSTRK